MKDRHRIPTHTRSETVKPPLPPSTLSPPKGQFGVVTSSIRRGHDSSPAHRMPSPRRFSARRTLCPPLQPMTYGDSGRAA
eukprot:229700-Amorphochlora_amoeboformis.AAC.2